ncbi:O-acetylhomoserine aminocarboxypropyltransferase/cysteine synthase family protein [Pseudoclavibacter sp. CFCC 13611]|uniref:O-acetylhomoserine aminocarboxypropyltransferase/cysteine synthase family protein n=1 Tax=Pseudoclavibacter sp. CFCC 13611 TaxID=2615178 RepID=UPI0013011312|nr:aminotransferase class I/II-fold pyridoxal phosphate-dependent enzyme [Pseudoclavibacter sp. CFCC 13611]KAB1664016.1 O-acetylhomoserine aminocarboxypropyltransferase/cysteine synthase [Pseudoclavibacter sp. CFCC 13611]
MAQEKFGFETRQIHAGEELDSDYRARVTPIYETAGYAFADFDDARRHFEHVDPRDFYGRTGNPTNHVVERRLADLEGGTDAVVLASGQAAISGTLLALVSSGFEFIATSSLYEGTKVLFRDALSRQGITVRFVDAEASDDVWEQAFTNGTRAVYTETIPNPKNDIVDLPRIAEIAHAHGVPLIVDNTVATPYLSRPIEHGADVVVHSTSKWLSGHANIIGGAVIDGGTFDWSAHADAFRHLTARIRPDRPSYVEAYGTSAFAAYLRFGVVGNYGQSFSPHNASLLLLGIETLSLRIEREVANAQRIAEYLETHPAVSSVDYPGLPSNRWHERAKRLLPLGAGAVVSFDLAGGVDAAARFYDALRLVSRMTHIGDLRTLAIHTGSTIHRNLTEQQRVEAGITPGLIRLSVGLETVEDIIADLSQALSSIDEADHGRHDR